MDLADIGQQMRLEALAVSVSGALSNAALPHAILKGPSTARWLYAPTRAFRDVDVLVPASRVADASATLERSGVARPDSGRLGEEASHAVVLHSSWGGEVDLHATLPLMTVDRHDPDRVWRALEPGLVDMHLDTGSIPCLGIAGRCLVLALHALGNPDEHSIPVADLRRAVEQADAQDWQEARALSERLDISDLFDGGLSLVRDLVGVRQLPLEARLLMDGHAGAFQLARLRLRPKREWPGVVLREAFPSRDFMTRVDPLYDQGTRRLLASYLSRLAHLARELPGQVRALREADRPGSGVERLPDRPGDPGDDVHHDGHDAEQS